MENNVLVTPIAIPQHPVILRDDPNVGSGSVDPGPPIDGALYSNGTNNHAIDRVLGLKPAVAPPPPAITHGPLHLSHIDEGLLVRKVTPSYPKLAMISRQQGSVVLEATISRDGSIENLRAISGPPLLIGAAIDAVRQWRYRPYLLNDQPVEVETQITVNFSLQQ